MNYYNEHDPKAAAWLRELIKQRLIPNGDVDERDIQDVQPNDLHRYTQCHFFAGIGGWSYALQLAGWPPDRPVWTGSCPCQPFSSAGKQMGRNDPRHLWPAFRRLINRCRPAVVFGEQVASADGRKWLSGVFANLETMGYAAAGADLCAAGVIAPHIRQRLFWVANADGIHDDGARCCSGNDSRELEPTNNLQGFEDSARMGQPDMHRCESGISTSSSTRHGDPAEPTNFWSDSIAIQCRDGKHRRIPTQPVFQFVSNGVPDMLGAGWDACLVRVKHEVLTYAEKASSRPSEALRAMWGASCKEALRQRLGRPDDFQEASLLLFGLCQLTWSKEPEFVFPTSDQRDIQERTMRLLWGNLSVHAACASPERRLDGPQTGELADALPILSHETPQSQVGEDMLRGGLFGEIQEARHVLEAFATLQEVWRSSVNEVASKGATEWVHARYATLIAVRGFPLADPRAYKLARRGSIRPALLHGAGNAIVPQVAAEFIKAYLETSGQ